MRTNKLIKSITVFTFLLLQLLTISYAGKPLILKFSQGETIFVAFDCTDDRDIMVNITGIESTTNLGNLPPGVEYRDFTTDEVQDSGKKGIVIHTNVYNICDKAQLRIYSTTAGVIKAVDFEEVEIESKILESTSPKNVPVIKDEPATKKTDSEEHAIQTENNAPESNFFTVFVKDNQDDNSNLGGIKMVTGVKSAHDHMRVVFLEKDGLSTCYTTDLTKFEFKRDGCVYTSVSKNDTNLVFFVVDKNHNKERKSCFLLGA